MPATSEPRPPDPIDRRLLATLRSKGRATFAELGRAVGLSAPSAHERVRRLEEAGVIRGYHAAVSPAALGLPVSALISIYVTDSGDQSDVATCLAGLPEVEDCWLVAGDEAFVVRVRVADVASLGATLARLRRVAGVARTRTTVVLSTPFEGRAGEPTAAEATADEATGAQPTVAHSTADDATPDDATPDDATPDDAMPDDAMSTDPTAAAGPGDVAPGGG